MNPSSMKYRPEIDGLRSVAVLPVILFHAGLNWVPGGFVGVDVFFVISGFLITTIIARELEQGRFSLIQFYERRARRILPALFLMLLVTTILSTIILLPYELKTYGRGLISVIVFASNILFWRETGYFAPSSELNPLLHTWSLAVEEQFYILFPMLLWALWKFRLRSVVLVLVLLTLGSLSLAELFSLRAPTPNFYLLPTRAWELLAGSLAGLYLMRRPQITGLLAEIVAFTGLAAIVWSIIKFSEATPFPSLWALAPVMGTVAIIIAASPSTLAGRILTFPPLVGLGLISYSAYLWHQPLFAFARILEIDHEPSNMLMAVLVVLTLVFAWISWRFVERPFRQRDVYLRRAIFTRAGIGSAIFVVVGATFMMTDGLVQRFPEEQRDWVKTHPQEYGRYVRAAYSEIQGAPTSEDSLNLVIVGDSFSQDFFNTITETGAFADYAKTAIYVSTRCQIHYGFPVSKIMPLVEEKDRRKCLKQFLTAEQVKEIRKADVVIFAAGWRDWGAERLATSIAAMELDPKISVFVVGSKSFERSRRYYLSINDPRDAVMAPSPMATKTAEILARTLPEGVFIDTLSLLCSLGCPQLTPGGQLISYDGAHLTKEGAAYLGQVLFSADPLRRYAPDPRITDQ